MIRRWSHINLININEKRKYRFLRFIRLKIFKKTIMLKRFNKKYSKTRRRAFTKLKHLANRFLQHNVFKFWAIDYHYNKYYCKAVNSDGFSINSFIFLNVSFMINKNPNIFFNWNFFSFNYSKKLLILFIKHKFLISPYPIRLHSIKSKAWTLFENDMQEQNELAFPSYKEWDNIWYELNTTTNNSFLLLFYKNIQQCVLSAILEFYKILLILSIF